MSNDDRTKAELQDELRQRDLPVSGTKQELLDRLEEAEGSDARSSKGGSKESEDAQGAEPDSQGSQSSRERSTERAPAGSEDQPPSAGSDGGSRGGRSSGRPKPMLLARKAAQQLRLLTGRNVEGVAGLRQVEDEWVITLEVLEVSRVPSSTDVLGSYEVNVNADGELLGYERVRRFVRGQASEE